MIKKRLITTKTLFRLTLLILVLTVLSIWLLGLGQHRTLFENSILSISVLSVAFFLFLTIGLYKGIKLKDDIGKVTNNLKSLKFPDLSNTGNFNPSILEVDGIAGIVLSILLWIVAMILFSLLIWLFGALLWSGIIIFIAMLYWIFFRAIRLVLKNSNKCRGNLVKSLTYGLGYTILYSSWIYGVVIISHYFI